MPTEDVSAPQDPADALAAVAGLRRLADRLGRQAIRDALDRQFEHRLDAAGVSLASYNLPKPFRDPEEHPKPGASTQLAIERGFAAANGKGGLRPAHLLLGVLSADADTVPRALTGVDRAGLMDRVEETLTRESR
ncbi:hypothetical protein ACFFV7_36390 [Nonomuraea spiralis]|uniref:Clp R domain-containing protein n=1 Tax=Nonomuraea spiralis TaxID=46182 RepID=A0ABV5IQ92_9ACTN|nr:Clp protease [Nonomuraea spiralis]GGT11987.1 hypothetical protein GCM10010176_065920 [Nonomuraea spiralis]